MRKVCLILLLVIVLINMQLSGSVFAQQQEFQEVVKKAQDDIKIINLLNSLSLKREQEIFILEKAREVKKIKDEAERRLASRESEILDTYERLKQEFQEGKVSVNNELKGRFRKQKNESEQITRQAQEKIDNITQEVESNLEAYQIFALKGYKPCIIPSEQSGRIGQSDKATRIIKIFERIRNIPEQHYYWKKEEVIDRLLDREKYKLLLRVSLDIEQLKLAITDIFREVRQLSDIDFQLQKGKLVEKIKAIVKLQPKKEVDTTTRIKGFLLSENIIPILEERISKSN